jgi:ATP-dependent RNA helicase RhlB
MLACETYVYHLEAVEEFIGEKIKMEWAEDDWYEKDQARRSGPRRKKTASSRPPAAPSPRRRQKTTKQKQQPKGRKSRRGSKTQSKST